MEDYFLTMFEEVRHERSLILVLSLTNPGILKQGKLTDHEISILKNLALEKLRIQRMLREFTALRLIDQYFLFNKKRPLEI